MTTRRNTQHGLGLITAAELTTLGSFGASAIAGGGGVIPTVFGSHTLDGDRFDPPT